MDRTLAGVQFSGGGRDLERVALQQVSITRHTGMGGESLMMLEWLPNSSPPGSDLRSWTRAPHWVMSPQGTFRDTWSHSGLSLPGRGPGMLLNTIVHRTAPTTENYRIILPQKSRGLRLGKPGLDGLHMAQQGLKSPPNKANAPNGGTQFLCQGLMDMCGMCECGHVCAHVGYTCTRILKFSLSLTHV